MSLRILGKPQPFTVSPYTPNDGRILVREIGGERN